MNSGRVIKNDDDSYCVEYYNSEGKLHREDGPAVIYDDGREQWFKKGDLHRVDGPAMIGDDGSEAWYQDDDLHRADGPAVTLAEGVEVWHLNNKLHREGGPAIIYPDGKTEFWVDGREIEEKHQMNGEKHNIILNTLNRLFNKISK